MKRLVEHRFNVWSRLARRLGPAVVWRRMGLAFLIAGLVWGSLGPSATEARAADIQWDACACNNKPLFGRVQMVEAFPDLKIKIVDAFPDLRVVRVRGLATRCGEWEIVDHQGDLRVQVVDAFEDLKVQYVDFFPGMVEPPMPLWKEPEPGNLLWVRSDVPTPRAAANWSRLRSERVPCDRWAILNRRRVWEEIV